MSVPAYDLNKVQFTSEANSFKNNSTLYQGNLVLNASIPIHGSLNATTTFTVPEPPQFCKLYAYYQEYLDLIFAGTAAQWYEASVNNTFGINVNSAPHVGFLDGLVYVVINGTTITVTALINNPYADAITFNALTIPFAFITYTMTN